MHKKNTDFFLEGEALAYTKTCIDLALQEDNTDLTSNALFDETQQVHAYIVAKEAATVCGVAYIPLIMERLATLFPESVAQNFSLRVFYEDGTNVAVGTKILELEAPARAVLKAERIILNFITHLSGIATLTKRYVSALNGTKTQVLDTRKTLPALRYPEKYAVLMGGGTNHRIDLAEMLMLKDNHIDSAGGITPAVERVRRAYNPCPPIEVECRTQDEVREAVACKVERIMLDNMNETEIAAALPLIPESIESEVSGGVSLESIRRLATASTHTLNYISVGRLTHSAPAADFSMRIALQD